jgi:hypothetical protein
MLLQMAVIEDNNLVICMHIYMHIRGNSSNSSDDSDSRQELSAVYVQRKPRTEATSPCRNFGRLSSHLPCSMLMSSRIRASSATVATTHSR